MPTTQKYTLGQARQINPIIILGRYTRKILANYYFRSNLISTIIKSNIIGFNKIIFLIKDMPKLLRSLIWNLNNFYLANHKTNTTNLS